ncbi:hypothetical protein ABZ471_44450 [Streptomyces sp. NPDC005728]|uniref:hypothetical protein n=1 Tax=Streptomyces sp. NPDC005728 TaxID=3157054 RepID=UPI0033EC88F3
MLLRSSITLYGFAARGTVPDGRGSNSSVEGCKFAEISGVAEASGVEAVAETITRAKLVCTCLPIGVNLGASLVVLLARRQRPCQRRR